MNSEIVHVNPHGRRLFRVVMQGLNLQLNLIAQAATEQEVRDWLTSQIGTAADDATITDAGHADRTEVTHWGLTDRI